MVLRRWARGTLPVVIRCRQIWVVKGADLTSSSGEMRPCVPPCHGSRELEGKASFSHRAKPAPSTVSQRAGKRVPLLHICTCTSTALQGAAGRWGGRRASFN